MVSVDVKHHVYLHSLQIKQGPEMYPKARKYTAKLGCNKITNRAKILLLLRKIIFENNVEDAGGPL